MDTIKSNETESMILKLAYRQCSPVRTEQLVKFPEKYLMRFDLEGFKGTEEFFCRFFKERMKQKTARIETRENKIIFWNNTERYSFDIAPSILKSIEKILEGRETDMSFSETTTKLFFRSTYAIRTLKHITV